MAPIRIVLAGFVALAACSDPAPAVEPDAAPPVDRDPPATVIDDGPEGVTDEVEATFTFHADEAATFMCSLDGAAEARCTSPHTLDGLADGEHELTVTATDTAGNEDPSPPSRTWTVDTTSPDTVIDAGPSGTVVMAAATFSFSSPDAGPGATFECQIDGLAFAGCTSPHALPALADGAHTFAVRVKDAAGNVDPKPASRMWTIDTLAPATQIDSGPPALDNRTTATFTFSSDGPATFECALDGGAFAACTTPAMLMGLAGGAHAFAVRARDAAGNVDPTPAQHAWTIDTAAPNTTITAGPSGLVSQTGATFMFTSTEPGGGFTCRLDGGPPAACNAGSIAYAGLAAGVHAFTVAATDPAGNVDPTPATRSWTIDATAPTVMRVTTTAPDGVYKQGDTIAVQVAFTEPVTASASMALTLETGPVDRAVALGGGSGTATLSFSYVVQAGDRSADLDVASAMALVTVGGTLRDAAGNDANVTLATGAAFGSLASAHAIVVDTIAPAVVGVTSPDPDGAYGLGAAITVRVGFDEIVTVTGAPRLTLETGAQDRDALYAGGSGTATLSFTYVVQNGDSSPDLDYAGAMALSLGGGSIVDGAGNPAALALPAPGAPGSLAAAKALAVSGVAASCLQLKMATPNAPSGNYTIDLDGAGPGAPLLVYCDMVDDGGGWTYWVHGGLVAYWSFDGASPANANVGGFLGTFTGNAGPSPTVVAAAFGSSAFFGENEPNRLDLSNNVTVGARSTFVFWGRNESCNNNRIPLWFTSGGYVGDLYYTASLNGNGGSFHSGVADCPQTGAWHHHAYVDDGASYRVLRDGQLVQPNSYSYSSLAGLAIHRIGNRQGNGTNGLHGYLDDVAVFDRALTDAELQLLHAQSLAGRPFRWR